MKKILTLAAFLAAFLLSVNMALAGCVLVGPGNTCLLWLPNPPPGGRDCTNSPPVAGEFAAYTAAGGWCVTIPPGDYPNMGQYFYSWAGPTYIVNKRSGWPVPPISSGYYGTNYTGGGINMPQGTYTVTSPLQSLHVR